VDFREQQRRLIAHLRALVRSGDATERGLARLTGVSQPHMHNVLKGKRLLSLEMADQVLAQLHLDLLDFIEPGELLEWQHRR
jgi:antitoxin component HigA of HigAB toxin-antitoxin module